MPRAAGQYADLIAITACSVGAFLLPVISIPTAFSVPLGIGLLLIAPGHVLLRAMLRQEGAGAAHSITNLERTVLTIGLSIAILILIGIVLNYTTGGISLVSVVTAIGIWNLSMSALIAYQISRLGKHPHTPKPSWGRGSTQAWTLVASIVIISVIIGVVAVAVDLPAANGEFTEFYLVDPADPLHATGSEVQSRTNFTIRVGIRNNEGAHHTYLITPYYEHPGNRTQQAALPHQVNLDHGETFETGIELTAPEEVGLYRVSLQLSRVGDPQYQNVHLWVTVKEDPLAPAADGEN